MKKVISSGFSALLLFVFAFAVYEAAGWPAKVRLFPLLIGIPTVVLTAVQLLLDGIIAIKKTPKSGFRASDIGLDNSKEHVRAIGFFIGIFALIYMIWLIGFVPAFLIYTVIYLKFVAKEKWVIVLVFTGCSAFVLWLFSRVLDMPLP